MATHRLIHNINSFLDLHYGALDVGDDLTSVRNVMTSLSDCHVRMHRKFGLKIGGQWCEHRRDCRTHFKHLKDSIEVRVPASNRVLIVLRVEKTGDRFSFPHFDDAPLDLGHGPAIEGW